MKTLKLFVSGILAGMSIGFGGLIFLSMDNKVLGALLFAVGLFMVCTFGFHLFTGKVCYVFFNDKSYALGLPVMWLGNLVGTAITAYLALATRIGPALSEKAAKLCEIKLNDSHLSLFVLGLLCDIFIYLAVEGYKNNPHELGKYMSILLGIMVFILCGTEHCVADMFYFWIAKAWSGKAIISVLVITVGNACGGVLIPLLRKFSESK